MGGGQISKGHDEQPRFYSKWAGSPLGSFSRGAHALTHTLAGSRCGDRGQRRCGAAGTLSAQDTARQLQLSKGTCWWPGPRACWTALEVELIGVAAELDVGHKRGGGVGGCQASGLSSWRNGMPLTDGKTGRSRFGERRSELRFEHVIPKMLRTMYVKSWVYPSWGRDSGCMALDFLG